MIAATSADLSVGSGRVGADSLGIAAYPSTGQHRPVFRKDRQMNTVTMTGRLTRDPQLKHAGDERPICHMRVAVDNGRHPTTYIDVTTFDAQAYICAEYLAKGRMIGVDGKLTLSEWRDAGGRNHQRYSVIGRVEFLDRRSGWDAEAAERPEPEPADSARPELVLAA
jgi:single-strand DNA-binding protein